MIHSILFFVYLCSLIKYRDYTHTSSPFFPCCAREYFYIASMYTVNAVPVMTNSFWHHLQLARPFAGQVDSESKVSCVRYLVLWWCGGAGLENAIFNHTDIVIFFFIWNRNWKKTDGVRLAPKYKFPWNKLWLGSKLIENSWTEPTNAICTVHPIARRLFLLKFQD